MLFHWVLPSVPFLYLACLPLPRGNPEGLSFDIHCFYRPWLDDEIVLHHSVKNSLLWNRGWNPGGLQKSVCHPSLFPKGDIGTGILCIVWCMKFFRVWISHRAFTFCSWYNIIQYKVLTNPKGLFDLLKMWPCIIMGIIIFSISWRVRVLVAYLIGNFKIWIYLSAQMHGWHI